MDSSLLCLLCCPETGQTLQLANEAELEELNLRIRSHAVLNHSGQTVSQPLEAALIRKDGRMIYPLRDGIPLLLVEESIAR